jgi:hypothetical protein
MGHIRLRHQNRGLGKICGCQRHTGGLQDAMRRLDASRCTTVASEGETERAPLRNEQTGNAVRALVN